MLSYNNDPTFKARFVEEILRHQQEDRIAQGTYGLRFGDAKLWRGCAVACSIRSLLKLEGYGDADGSLNEHGRMSESLGVPLALVMLEEVIFESSGPDYAQTWPARFSQAIPVGKDLSRLPWRFLFEQLTRVPSHLREEIPTSHVVALITQLCETDIPKYVEMFASTERDNLLFAITNFVNRVGLNIDGYADERLFYEDLGDRLIELLARA